MSRNMSCVGIVPHRVIIAVAEDAFDSERVEPGLECRAEARMMDPLSRLGVGWERCVGLGVKQKGRRVIGRDVVER